jgi:hypothetical protein
VKNEKTSGLHAPPFTLHSRFAPTLNSTRIFASPENLRFPLSGLQKRHMQPERYMQCRLNQAKIYKIKIYLKISGQNNGQYDTKAVI